MAARLMPFPPRPAPAAEPEPALPLVAALHAHLLAASLAAWLLWLELAAPRRPRR